MAAPRLSRIICTAIALVLTTEVGVFAAKPPSGGGGGGGGTLPTYSITLLGTLGGESSHASAMNNRGDVVGYSYTGILGGRSWEHAFLNVGGGTGARLMIDLNDKFVAESLFTTDGPLKPFDYVNWVGSYVQQAEGINDNGQIVVGITTRVAGQNAVSNYYRYTPPGTDGNGNPAPAKLDALVGGEAEINAFGDVATSAGTHALLWTEANGTTDLGTALGQDARVFGLNDQRQLCGGNSVWYRAWRYTPDVGFKDLGVLKGGAYSFAHGINNSGQVAVTCRQNSGEYRICRFTDGQALKFLGSLGGTLSESAGINSSGSVVGWSDTAEGGRHLCLYTDKNGMFDLNAATVNLPVAMSGILNVPYYGGRPLNDAHQVCGTAGDFGYSGLPLPNGHTYEAFLLVPQN